MKSILLLIGLLISPLSQANESEIQVVKSFVEAYNQQDLEAMLDLTTSDVSWMSVESKKLSIITADKVKQGNAGLLC